MSELRCRIAEIRQEGRGGDVSTRDIEWLCRIAEAADAFHSAFWNPWRSGRAVVMTADKVAEAYGELRRALSLGHYESSLRSSRAAKRREERE